MHITPKIPNDKSEVAGNCIALPTRHANTSKCNNSPENVGTPIEIVIYLGNRFENGQKLKLPYK